VVQPVGIRDAHRHIDSTVRPAGQRDAVKVFFHTSYRGMTAAAAATVVGVDRSTLPKTLTSSKVAALKALPQFRDPDWAAEPGVTELLHRWDPSGRPSKQRGLAG
jgi:hypothetical protein